MQQLKYKLILSIVLAVHAPQMFATTTWCFPGPCTGTTASAPLSMGAGDTFNMNSSLFATPSGNNTAYSVYMAGAATINVGAGSTISYAGSNPSAATISSTVSGPSVTQNLFIHGTIAAGSGANAISTATTATKINFYPGAILNGNINVAGSQIYFNGNAQVNGNITATGSTIVYVGNDSTGTFYPNSTFNPNGQLNIPIFLVANNSTATFNYSNTIGNLNTQNSVLNINQPLSVGDIGSQDTTTSIINMAANVAVSGSGSATISVANLVVGSSVNATFQSAGTFTVTNIFTSVLNSAANYGNLTITGVAVGSASIANLAVEYTGGLFPTGTYTLLSVNTPLTGTTTISSVPKNTMFNTFATPVIGTSSITIAITHTDFATLATGTVNIAIASVLDAMQTNKLNQGQLQLLNAVAATPTQTQYNHLLHRLMPLLNANAAATVMQYSLYDAVEARVFAVHDNTDAGLLGVASGEINNTTAMWIGSIGNQGRARNIEVNDGYKLKALGTLVGIDKRYATNSLIGAAFAVTNSNVYDSSNSDFKTRILGLTGLLYGSNESVGDMFLEWLVSATSNKNDGSRHIHAPTGLFNVASSYRNIQAGAKLNLVKDIAINQWLGIAQVNGLSLVYTHQPAYSESGSPAALYVQPKNNQYIFTAASGFRLSLPGDSYWVNGTRALRAMVSYDMINSNNVVIANFLVGSQPFTISNPNQRLAFDFGVEFGICLCRNLQVQRQYDYQYRKHSYDSAGSIKLKYVF